MTACCPTMKEKPVTAILFDLDNTLIETSRAGGEAIKKVRESERCSCSLNVTPMTWWSR